MREDIQVGELLAGNSCASAAHCFSAYVIQSTQIWWPTFFCFSIVTMASGIEHTPNDRRWSCSTCTYLNSFLAHPVCQICFTKVDKQSLQWKCDTCTLQNEASNLCCDACGRNKSLTVKTYFWKETKIEKKWNLVLFRIIQLIQIRYLCHSLFANIGTKINQMLNKCLKI
jgi:hypothetical protein